MGPFCFKRKILKSNTEHPRSFVIWHLPAAFQSFFYQCSHAYKSMSQLHQITRISQTHHIFLWSSVLSWLFPLLKNALSTSSLTLLKNYHPSFKSKPPTLLSVKRLRDCQREVLASVFPWLSAHLRHSLSD